MSGEQEEKTGIESVTRRDALKLGASALASVAAAPGLSRFGIEFGKEGEPGLRSELVIKTGFARRAEVSMSVNAGYIEKLEPLPVEGETYDSIDNFPKRPLTDLLSEAAMDLCRQNEIIINSSFGIDRADFGHPTFQIGLATDSYKNRVELLKAVVNSDKDNNLVLPDVADNLNNSNTSFNQLLLLPAREGTGDNIIIWSHNGKLNLEKIPTPEGNTITAGGVSIIANGIVEVRSVDKEDNVHKKYISFGESTVSIPTGENEDLWIPPPKHSPDESDFNIRRAVEGADDEVYVGSSPGGGVYRISRRGDNTAISLWDVSLGDFLPAIETKNLIDKDTPVFIFGGKYAGFVSESAVVKTEDSKSPAELSLTIYGFDNGVQTTIPLESEAAQKMLEGYWSPEIESDPERLREMCEDFESTYPDIDFQKTVTGSPSIGLKANRQASGTGEEELMLLIMESYDAKSQKHSLWVRENLKLKGLKQPILPKEVHA